MENQLKLIDKIARDAFPVILPGHISTFEVVQLLIDYFDKTPPIYAVRTEWVIDTDSGSNLELFSNKDAANKYFHEEVASILKDFGVDDGNEDINFKTDTGENFFEVYEDGHYSSCHGTVEILEKPIHEVWQ